MSRKQRYDTAAGQLALMQSVLGDEIQPPEHVRLRDGDLPFWKGIIAGRPKSDWDIADLEMAANLARCKADIERLQTEIDQEGDVVLNLKGTQIVNPKHTLLETLTRRAVALSRMLHVHPEAKVGESRESAKRKKAETVVEDGLLGIPKPADDDLLAGVSMQ